MAETSARFGLPAIVAGQAQKEVTHNEALAIIDAVLHPVVETLTRTVPPGEPAIGMAWVVAPGATGEWAGHVGQIACWTDGGWRFAAPVAGMLAWVADRGQHAFWTGTAWSTGPLPVDGVACGGRQVVGARQPAIAAAEGGVTVDAEARATVLFVLKALRTHGLIDT